MHTTQSTTHSLTTSRNSNEPPTTDPCPAHAISPSHHLHPLVLDSVSCIYSCSTRTVTQLALRPARDELDVDVLEALYGSVKAHVASLVASVLKLAESEALPSSARAFRVEQRFDEEGQAASGPSSSGYSLTFQRQSSVVSASKWVWSLDGDEVRWSAHKWRVEFARL